METLQQQMAINALERVRAFEAATENAPQPREKYRTMALKLPALILTDGLVQSLAFVQARGDEAQLKLLDDVAATAVWPGVDSGEALVARSRTAELSEYMILTRRVLAALVWYKRYAESVLMKPESQPILPGQTAQADETAVPVEGEGHAQ
jgi:CRISPR-associated protein Cmr5